MANEKINILLEAQDNASKPLKNVRANIDQVGASAKRTASQAKGVQESIGGVGRGAGMAGIQVQQFVGQLQGGVNPMVALSQQSADLGFALGVPLVGAIVSVGAVIAGTLLPSLMEAERSFADLRKEAENLGIGLTQLPSKLTEQNLMMLGTTAGEAGQKVQRLQREMAALAQQRDAAQSIGATADEFGDLGTNVEAIDAEIESLSIELAKANVELEIANRNVMDFSDALYGQYQRAANARKEIKNYYDTIKAAKVDQRDHLATLRGQAEAVKMQINPLIGLQAERQKLQSMEANGLLTTQEYNIALAEAKEKYENMIPSVRDARAATEAFKNSAVNTITDGLIGLINGTRSAKDAFKSMTTSIINDLIRIAIQKKITASISGGFLGGIGGFIGSLFSFDGGGYTGSGARTGGVDGKGGFPAILHPNETVVDHTKGQSSGGTQAQNVNVTFEISTVDAKGFDSLLQSRRGQIIGMINSAMNERGSRGIV